MTIPTGHGQNTGWEMLNKVLRSYRASHGLSQTEVADQLGISRNYVSMIERRVSCNLSYALAQRILNLGGDHHGQVQVTLTRQVWVDSTIAEEIVWLNSQGVVTCSCCQGPPPTALILPSSGPVAMRLGYLYGYREDLGLCEIDLKSRVGDGRQGLPGD